MEILEYYNRENTVKLGEDERDKVHENNLWHREIAVWILNENNEVLLQKRSPNKKQSPNKYTVCTGHVDPGESIEEAAIRELLEETSIKVKKEDLIFIELFENPDEGNKHFKYVYLTRTNKKLEELKMQEEEVTELKYVSLKEIEEMVERGEESLTFSKKSYAKPSIQKIKKIIGL